MGNEKKKEIKFWVKQIHKKKVKVCVKERFVYNQAQIAGVMLNKKDMRWVMMTRLTHSTWTDSENRLEMN